MILRHSFNKSSVTPIYGAGAADFKFEGDPRSPADMLTLLLFSAAVWRASSFYRVRGITPSNPQTAAMKIARSFLSLRKKVLRRSTKKAKKEEKARKRIAALHKKLDSLGPHLEIATDGSSIPNPGPTGAGYVMREVDYGSNDYTFFSSTSLGHGTNNLGEIEALQSALNRVVSNLPPPGVKIIFLIDSEFALNIANSIHHSKAYPETASNIIQLRQTLQKTHTTLLEWSPAHFDFAINEVADGLAKRGAAGVTSNDPPDIIPQDRAGSPLAPASGPPAPPPRPGHPQPALPPSDMDPLEAKHDSPSSKSPSEEESDESIDREYLRDLFSLGTLANPRPDLTEPGTRPGAKPCMSSDEDAHEPPLAQCRPPHRRLSVSCISSDEEDEDKEEDPAPQPRAPDHRAPLLDPLEPNPPRRSTRKRNHIRTFTQIDFSMVRKTAKPSRTPSPASMLQSWLADATHQSNHTEDQADRDSGPTQAEPDDTSPPLPSHSDSPTHGHPTSVETAGDEDDWEGDQADDDLGDFADCDSDEGDGDADPEGGCGRRGDTGLTIPSDITPQRRGEGAHSAPDQTATGRVANSGACVLESTEMSSRNPSTPPSLSPPASPLPLLVPAGTSSTPLSLSAHSPSLFSLFSHWDSGRQRSSPSGGLGLFQDPQAPPPRRKPYAMDGIRDVDGDIRNEVVLDDDEGNTDEYDDGEYDDDNDNIYDDGHADEDDVDVDADVDDNNPDTGEMISDDEVNDGGYAHDGIYVTGSADEDGDVDEYNTDANDVDVGNEGNDVDDAEDATCDEWYADEDANTIT